jgi:hypothetical protein
VSDYRLDISQITMRTEGGGIVHAEDEAFATEKVVYYAEVSNHTDQFLGPLEVSFLVDGKDIGWGGMSHQGIGAGETHWFNGFTDHLSPGNHTLHIKIVPGDTLFDGGEQSVDLRVLEPKSRRAMPEGQEQGHSGWEQRQVYLWVEDFRGKGLPHGEAYVTFSGPGGEAAERGSVVDGDLTLDNVWTPKEGNIRLVIATQQSGNRQLQGGTHFAVGGESLHLAFSQDKEIVKRTASSAQEVATMVGATGSIGVDFKIFSLGAEVTTEHSWSETHEEGVEFDIWLPTDALQHSGDDTAAARDR